MTAQLSITIVPEMKLNRHGQYERRRPTIQSQRRVSHCLTASIAALSSSRRAEHLDGLHPSRFVHSCFEDDDALELRGLCDQWVSDRHAR